MIRAVLCLSVLLAASAQAQEKVELNTVTAVTVRGNEIVIVGSRKPNFTTFTMSDPPRLVIDISEAVFKGVPNTLPGTGHITGLKTASYGSDASAIARVLVGFDKEIETDIQTQGDTRLVVKLLNVAAPTVVAATETTADAGTTNVTVVTGDPDGQARRDAEAAAKRAADELAAQQQAAKQAEQAARRDAEEAAKAAAEAQKEASARAQAEQKRADEEARLAAERAQQAQAAQDREAEARARQQAEAEARAQKQAAEQARLEAERLEKQQQAEAERARLAAEKAAREEKRRAAEEAKQRSAEDARLAQQQQREEAEAQRAAAEAERRDREEQANAKRKAALEAKRAEEAERRAQLDAERKAALEAKRAKEDERRAQIEAQRQAREDAKRAAADARRAAEEDRRRRAEQARAAAEAQKRATQDQKTQRAAMDEQPAFTESVQVSPRRKLMSFVGFSQQTATSRIYVRTSEPVRYAIGEEGKLMVVLTLENTAINMSNNARQLDTSYFDTAVQGVKATPGTNGSVRVEISMKNAAPYRTRQAGNEVWVDFQRPARN